MAWSFSVRRLFLFAVSAVTIGRSLLLPPPEVQASESAVAASREDLGADHLPDYWEYRNKWRGYNRRFWYKIGNGDREAAHVKLVIGVFSRADGLEMPHRSVVRETWMDQKGVCRLPFNPSSECSVYVTFVVGTGGDLDASERDMTLLPAKDTMDEGKTRVWFQHASGAWTWATHIMKMDLDAFPNLRHILYRIGTHSSTCANHYGGILITPCGNYVYEPSCKCGNPEGEDFLKYRVSDVDCFTYMQGGGYFLSRELAANASQAGEWWDRDISKHCYPEDVTTGHAIKRYGAEHDVCVSMVRLSVFKYGVHFPGRTKETTGCPGRTVPSKLQSK
eukprot:CAMPEP_0171159032 /NCGR_PEP_ID=MMETSP0790-20130122/2826_1 /TAXON_ID=2925 /ORGANISM="Alexandrium catenella, Strain OF101" /LENGTH=333 /DNA_ID=CAMNT_0011623509 /DNA_START=16 /DNA_END=1017 /DNA_ORIENTATION=-